MNQDEVNMRSIILIFMSNSLYRRHDSKVWDWVVMRCNRNDYDTRSCSHVDYEY